MEVINGAFWYARFLDEIDDFGDCDRRDSYLVSLGNRVTEKGQAALPSRGSENMYQITAWVSAIAIIITYRNAGNSRTSLRGFGRSPLSWRMGQEVRVQAMQAKRPTAPVPLPVDLPRQ